MNFRSDVSWWGSNWQYLQIEISPSFCCDILLWLTNQTFMINGKFETEVVKSWILIESPVTSYREFIPSYCRNCGINIQIQVDFLLLLQLYRYLASCDLSYLLHNSYNSVQYHQLSNQSPVYIPVLKRSKTVRKADVYLFLSLFPINWQI